MTQPTPQELVDQMVSLIGQIHDVFDQASTLADAELPPACRLRFRALRRDFSRWHHDGSQFIDECMPDTTIASGTS